MKSQQVYAPPKIHNAAVAIRKLHEIMDEKPNMDTAIALQSAQRRQRLRLKQSLRLIVNPKLPDQQ